jgi:glutaryl-CoA dehydrogenase
VSTATTTDSADFYALEDLLDAGEQAYLHSGRDVMASEVEPTVNRHWQRGSFPFEIVPGFRQLGLAGLPYHGFGCPGKSFLLDGMVTMELARTDPSIATFAAVHGGLAMGSIYLCGSEDQKQRYLPAMARYEKIGAFGLTEPDVGSALRGT